MTIIQSIIRAMREFVMPPRHTVPLPSVLTPMSAAAQPLPKPTPQNLRKFAETPIARRAINIVKDRVAGMAWRIQPKNGRAPSDLPNAAERIRMLTDNLDTPNPQDSFRSLA